MLRCGEFHARTVAPIFIHVAERDNVHLFGGSDLLKVGAALTSDADESNIQFFRRRGEAGARLGRYKRFAAAMAEAVLVEVAGKRRRVMA